jgi:hypothetical protein
MYRKTKTALANNLGLIVVGVAGFACLWHLLLWYWPEESLFRGVLVWWTALCAISVINICAWRLSASALLRQKTTAEPDLYLFQRRQLLLSAVYVLGCAFRAVLPRADVQRIGLFDSFASSVLVGRSVATVAEMCFVAQWALLLNKISRDNGSRIGVVISWILVPLIALAEINSWAAVLTTCYLGNAIEESLWALSVSLLVVSCIALWSRCGRAYRPFLAASLALGVGYVTFMCMVDIPMYVGRWLVDEASGREYLSLSQGLQDVWSRWVVTIEWEEWRTEIPWMSLYFSVAVWCSLALVHSARFLPAQPNSSRSG